MTLRFCNSTAMSCCAGVLAIILASLRINHGLVNSSLPAGPGLTLDESFNVGQGVYLAGALRQHGPLLFSPSIARRVFGAEAYLPDHPPLGRVLIGLAHQSTDWLIGGAESCPLNVTAARLGPCLALGLLTVLVAEYCRRHFGSTTALCSTAMLLCMPQLVGHARLATLEIPTCLAWFAALMPLLTWWTGSRPPGNRQAIVSGLLWGLLMLTKMQGILLPPLVAGWALWHFRMRAFRPLLLWGLSGAALFFVAWPWLWLNPVQNTWQYLGRATDRQTLYVWYFGKRFADAEVPWHFPWVMTLITVPLPVLLGLATRLLLPRLAPAEKLLLLSVLWPLTVFALPGTPVYDGSRLFLCTLPSMAVLAGHCCHRLVPSLMLLPCVRRWQAAAAILIITALIRTVCDGALLSPFAIDDYSDLVGGPRGAARLGMEASYWSDGLNGDFWNTVPEGATLFVAPVSHQFQLTAIETLVPIVQQRRIRLQPFQYDPLQQKGLLLLLHRLADLRQSLRVVPPGGQLMSEVTYRGVVLARIVDSSNATWTETP